MPEPTTYTPDFDFTATDKGTQLNVELQNISNSTESLAGAIADVRRSDGALQNGIVTQDAMDAALLRTFNAQAAIEAADEAEGFAAQAGRPFETRAALLAAEVPSAVTRTSFFVNGNIYAVVRDAAGPIVQDNGQTWRPDGDVTPQHFGAVADGFFDANLYPSLARPAGYGGTDNRAPFQKAIDYCQEARLDLSVPAGKYTFARVSGGRNNIILSIAPALDSRLTIVMDAGAELLIDYDPEASTDINKDDWFFATPNANSAFAEGMIYGEFHIRGGAIRSLWNHTFQSHRTHVFRIFNSRGVSIEGCHIRDISGGTSFSEGNGYWYSKGNRYKRLASGAVRSRGTPDVQVIGDHFKHIGDDVIDPHGESLLPDANRPLRSGLIVSACIFEDLKGINAISATSVIITGNIFKRCHGAISLWAQSSGTGEGAGANRSISVTGNVIEDGIKYTDIIRSDGVNPAPTAFLTARSNSILLGGAIASGDSGNSIKTGEYNPNSGNFIVPQGRAGVQASYMWARDQVDEGSDSSLVRGYSSNGFIVSGNIIKRTLGPVAKYSDWGFGKMFTKNGWADIEVTMADFNEDGILLNSQMVGVTITGNEFFGLNGSGIYFKDKDTPHEYRNVTIDNNRFYDCWRGIDRELAGDTTWDVTIKGNIFDLDPFGRMAGRKTGPRDGSWGDPGASIDICCGVRLNEVRGVVITGNSFRNCLRPILVHGSGSANPSAVVIANILFADFSSEGWSAGNKGIGWFNRWLDAWYIVTEDCDPTSTTFRNMLRAPVIRASGVPDSGWFYRGQVVKNINPSHNTTNDRMVMGWRRLTTGTAHVLSVPGTAGDWVQEVITVV